jgi:aminopeptidase YwaD
MTRPSPSARPGSAPADPGDADITRLQATIAELAADTYQGRRVGTPGGQAAAAWLARQLTDLGATVTTETFHVSAVRDLYATPALRWRDRDLVHRRDFVEHLASADLPAPRSVAIADALVPRGVDAEGWMPKMIAGPPQGDRPLLAVRTDLHARMVAEGGEVTITVPLRTIETTGTNIHAVLTEGSPSVLLTAHYDGVGDDPEQRLPAAADNASGVAVVLEAARLLASSGIGIAIALLDAEEAGAQGSAHHAPHVPPGTPVINVDGAAELADAAAVEAGGPATALLAALDQAGRDTGVPLRAGAMPSDNRRYAAAGLPAIGIGMGIPGYQTPAETPDRVDPATLIAATRLLVATVRHLV